MICFFLTACSAPDPDELGLFHKDKKPADNIPNNRDNSHPVIIPISTDNAPSFRENFAVATEPEGFYVFGGNSSLQVHSSLYHFDAALNKWTHDNLGGLLSPRLDSFMAIHGDLIFIWGGSSYNLAKQDRGDSFANGVIFNRITKQITYIPSTLASSPSARYQGSIAYFNERFCLFGGINQGVYLSGLYCFDPIAFSWHSAEDAQAIHPRINAFVVPYKDTLLIAAGRNLDALSDAYLVDEDNSVRQILKNDELVARYKPLLTLKDDVLIMGGGFREEGILELYVAEIRFPAPEWVKATSRDAWSFYANPTLEIRGGLHADFGICEQLNTSTKLNWFIAVTESQRYISEIVCFKLIDGIVETRRSNQLTASEKNLVSLRLLSTRNYLINFGFTVKSGLSGFFIEAL